MPKVLITIAAAGLLHRAPIVVNGRTYPVEYNKPFDLPEDALDAALVTYPQLQVIAEDEPVSLPADGGDGDGTAVPLGGEGGGAGTFDADAVIAGNVDAVKAKLADLTLEQLEAVAAAEADREKPRVGVTEAVAEAMAALSSFQ